jgi:hypothetical protein
VAYDANQFRCGGGRSSCPAAVSLYRELLYAHDGLLLRDQKQWSLSSSSSVATATAAGSSTQRRHRRRQVEEKLRLLLVAQTKMRKNRSDYSRPAADGSHLAAGRGRASTMLTAVLVDEIENSDFLQKRQSAVESIPNCLEAE